MSKFVNRTGTFRGRIVDSGVSLTSKSKVPQFVAHLVADEYYDEETQQWIDWSEYEEREISAYLVLISGDGKVIFHAENLQKALGWSGHALSELEEADYSNTTVQFRVEENEYEGKTTLQVKAIDHADADPAKRLQKLDLDEVKALDAKFAGILRSKFGGPKPKKAGDKPGKPTGSKPKSDPGTTKPGKGKKSSKPPKPAAAASKEKNNIAEHLNLPAEATEDEAWEQFEQNASGDFLPAQREKKWLDTVEELGGCEAIDKENDWARVRDICLETMTDNPNL